MKKIIALVSLIALNTFAQETVTNTRGEYFFYPVQIIDIVAQTFKPNTGTNRNQTGQNLTLKGGKSFGMFEVGGILNYSNFDYDRSEKSTETAIGLLGQLNFTPNTSEYPLIPYISLEYWITNLKQDNTTDDTIKGNRTYLSVGALYFPWDKLIAIDPNLTYSIRKYDADVATDYEYSGLNVSLDFRVYF